MADTATLEVPTEVPTLDEAPAAEARPLPQPATPDRGGFIWGTGRRKTAVARVRIRPAKDKAKPVFLVNGKEVDAFFTEPQHRADCRKAFEATGTTGALDVYVNVHGGGITGQAGAVLLGVSRALKGYDPSLDATLREHGFLTRDAREVERKKYGMAGARRRFQFSKR